MRSKDTVKAIIRLYCVLGSLAVAAGGGELLPDFINDALGTNAVRRALVLDEAAGTEVLRIMDGNDPETRVAYWQAAASTAWILQGRGRTGVFTAGFVVYEGRIVDCRVLEYHESHGRAIKSKRFLRQFRNAGLRDDRQLDRRIDGVTGATISVKSITNLARLALFLDQIRLRMSDASAGRVNDER